MYLQHSAHVSGGLSKTDFSVVVVCAKIPDIHSKNGLRSLPFPIKFVDVTFACVTSEFSSGKALARNSTPPSTASGCNIYMCTNVHDFIHSDKYFFFNNNNSYSNKIHILCYC